MNDNPIPEDRKNLTPLNVMGLIQGKVFPRSAPSTGFPIKAPKEVKTKAILNRVLPIATSAFGRPSRMGD